MHADNQPTLLLASPDAALRAAISPLLAATGMRVESVATTEEARALITSAQAPCLVILDGDLPGASLGSFLAAARAITRTHALSIVLLSDTINNEWTARLAESVLDDLIQRSPANPHWRMRLDMVLRANRRLNEASAHYALKDPLTGTSNRSALLTALFRETDRVQRMRTPLCLLLFDIDRFGDCNARLGSAACDLLLCQIAERTARLLRSYDLFGRIGNDEFLLVLPGCSTVDAITLAERLQMEIFGSPFPCPADSAHLTSCIGIASSAGRSPVVVLREAEIALLKAKARGPSSIQRFGNSLELGPEPEDFLPSSAGEELLAW